MVNHGRGRPGWAAQIRQWRVQHRWTQQQLARRLRQIDPSCLCDHGTVSRWERGLHRPSALHEQILCEAFEKMILAGADGPTNDRRAYVYRALALDSRDGNDG